MRINKYLAQATSLSRRAADAAIEAGRVLVNNQAPTPGQTILSTDTVTLDGTPVTPRRTSQTIMLNKPTGYVCSRKGQGSRTIYELLPQKYQQLNSIGRLDKDSSGLLLLTDDGQLAQKLAHPSQQKEKIYQITLHRTLTKEDQQTITEQGVALDDGPSIFKLQPSSYPGYQLQATLTEGRNRQIRRTFAALDYTVTGLHRTQFGEYVLHDLAPGKMRTVKTNYHSN